MSGIVRWEDPSPRNHTDVAASWQPVADELRAHPGQWALVRETSLLNAGVQASYIKSGKGPFEPRGAFEARQRTYRAQPGAQGVGRIYARYVGEPS